MKIAIDVAQTCVDRAGCGCHADALARAMSQIHPKEELILYHHFGDWINASTKRGTHIDGVEEPFATVSSEEAKSLWDSIQTGASMPPGEPDIIHSNSFMAPKFGFAKLVYTVHDLCFWTHPQFSSVQNRITCQGQMLNALQRSSGIIFISEKTKHDFEEIFPNWLERNRRPCKTITSGSRLQPSGKIKQSNRFFSHQAPWLHVGAIEPRKGIRRLLKTYTHYYRRSDRKRPLLLLGPSGWLSSSLHELIQSSSRELPITYRGHVSDQELITAYEEAFGLLCSSYYEGFGLPIVEAAVHGLPIVSSDVPSFQPFRSVSPFYAKMKFDDAVELMLNLERDPALYETTSLRTESFSRRFSYENAARKTLLFYKSLFKI